MADHTKELLLIRLIQSSQHQCSPSHPQPPSAGSATRPPRRTSRLHTGWHITSTSQDGTALATAAGTLPRFQASPGEGGTSTHSACQSAILSRDSTPPPAPAAVARPPPSAEAELYSSPSGSGRCASYSSSSPAAQLHSRAKAGLGEHRDGRGWRNGGQMGRSGIVARMQAPSMAQGQQGFSEFWMEGAPHLS